MTLDGGYSANVRATDSTPTVHRVAAMRDPNQDETASADPLAARGVRTLSIEAGSAGNTPHLRRDNTVPDSPVIPGYDILEQIGDGGMGVVYKANEPAFHRQVALKVMKAAFDGAVMRQRFEAEATLLRQLDHRNVVRVYAAGEAGPCVYYAMKLVDGGPLSDRLREYRRDAATAVRLMAKIARAVQYLHDRGVWHRDLKPQNILIDDGGEPLVADFGVAKWVEGDLHSLGFTRVGTYAYMAPEMIELGSAKCGPQADVWSLGVMLHELLAGARPFPGENRDPTLPARVVNDPPSPLTESPKLAPGTDDRLERIVLTALAKEPARRYPSAAALADDLDLWLTDATMDTRPLADARRHATRAEPVAPSWRRRRLIAAAVVGVLTAFAFAWPRPPKPDPALTAYDVLVRDGEVLVVDDKGTRLFDLSSVPGSQGGVQTAAGGYLAVTGSPVTLAEIASVAPPFPFRIEAEVRHEFGIPAASHAGVYGGRRSHAVPGAKSPRLPEHLLYALTVDACSTLDEPPPPGAVVAGGVRFDPNDRNDVDYVRVSEFKPKAVTPRHPFLKDGDDPEYFRLVLDVYPDRFQPVFRGEGFRGNTVEDLAGKFGSAFALAGRPVPVPFLGDGFGLIAKEATGAFRNVWVRKISP